MRLNNGGFISAADSKSVKEKEKRRDMQKGHVKILEASIQDANVLASIISESNKDVAITFNLNQDNNPKHPSFCDANWVKADVERGEEYFLYQEAGQSVACVAFENPRIGVGYLNRLSVLPEHRCKGIGEALVQHVMQYAASKQISRVSIGIIAEHHKLKHWYLKLGFKEGDIKTFPHLPFDVQYLHFVI